jgi:hypothetical protein
MYVKTPTVCTAFCSINTVVNSNNEHDVRGLDGLAFDSSLGCRDLTAPQHCVILTFPALCTADPVSYSRNL